MDKNRIVDFFESQIGPGRRFATRVAMAEFLGLPQSQATKLFNFIKGADTQYKSVLDWFEKLGGKLLPPDGEASKDVYFVSPKVVPVGEHIPGRPQLTTWPCRWWMR